VCVVSLLGYSTNVFLIVYVMYACPLGTIAEAKFTALKSPLEFYEWVCELMEVLNSRFPDKRKLSYSVLVEIMGIVGLHRRRKLESGTQKGVNLLESGKGTISLTKNGKLFLQHKTVKDTVHPTCEAFAFMVLKGKVSFMPHFVNWDRDESVFDGFDFLTWKDILHVQSRVGKGESLPLASKGGIEWRWTPQSVKEYNTVVLDIVENNKVLHRAAGTAERRCDIYNFTDLDENEWKAYNISRGCKGKRKEKVPAVVIDDRPVSLNLMEVVEERALPAELSDYSDNEDDTSIVHDTA
jgi:hypothetical protein